MRLTEVKADIWGFWEQGNYIVIPTNGTVKANGSAVMGRGLALQAKKRFIEMPAELGGSLKICGNEICVFYKYHLITFPVKHNWWEEADISLIETSCKELKRILDSEECGIKTPIYIPKVGTGNGKLSWPPVKAILEKYLDDRVIICDLK